MKPWTLVAFGLAILLIAGADRGWSKPWLLALTVAVVAVWDIVRRRRKRRAEDSK